MGIPQSQQTACRVLHWVKNAALSFSNWRVVLRTLDMCHRLVVLRAGVGPAWVECVVLSSWLCAVWCHGWFGVRPLGICAIPLALTVELSKLDMNNGPTISGRTILRTYDSIAF